MKETVKPKQYRPLIFAVEVLLQMPAVSNTIYTAVFEHVSQQKRRSAISYTEIRDGVIQTLQTEAVKRKRGYRTKTIKLISVEVKEVGLLSSDHQKYFLLDLEVPFRVKKDLEIKVSEDFLVELDLELQSGKVVEAARFEWIKYRIDQHVSDPTYFSPASLRRIFNEI